MKPSYFDQGVWKFEVYGRYFYSRTGRGEWFDSRHNAFVNMNIIPWSNKKECRNYAKKQKQRLSQENIY